MSPETRQQSPDDGGAATRIVVPVPSLVLLIGPSGSGKSTFATSHFGPYEVISSDQCRAIISDSDDDQAVTPAAFELLRFIARQRLVHGRLSVVDATNIHTMARQRNLELAAECRVPTVAIVFDISVERCLANNGRRTGRRVDQAVILEQRRVFVDAMPRLEGEGYGAIYRLDDRSVDFVSIVRDPNA